MPESLRRRLEETSKRALASGALEPIATRESFIDDGGIRFAVRLVERERKEASLEEQEASGRDPFLPYDPELFVADVSGTHVALLNKFNVLENHLLVVTRDFEEQESLLTREDFEAVWAVLGELDYLCFYNAGAIAGASQRHKHLQLVPPLGPEPGRCPVEALLSAGRWKELPFRCHFETLASASPRSAQELYLRSLEAIGRSQDPRAYNLLLTREWMLAVPRLREDFESISVNALGFAGAFLVDGREELERLRRVRPTSVLKEVAA